MIFTTGIETNIHGRRIKCLKSNVWNEMQTAGSIWNWNKYKVFIDEKNTIKFDRPRSFPDLTL